VTDSLNTHTARLVRIAALASELRERGARVEYYRSRFIVTAPDGAVARHRFLAIAARKLGY